MVMISHISPNAGLSEYTFNTLIYAYRVKGFSKSNKKDSQPLLLVHSGDSFDYNYEASVAYFTRKIGEIPPYYRYNGNIDGHSSNVSSNYSFNTIN
jgi:hypothetical protein